MLRFSLRFTFLIISLSLSFMISEHIEFNRHFCVYILITLFAESPCQFPFPAVTFGLCRSFGPFPSFFVVFPILPRFCCATFNLKTG